MNDSDIICKLKYGISDIDYLQIKPLLDADDTLLVIKKWLLWIDTNALEYFDECYSCSLVENTYDYLYNHYGEKYVKNIFEYSRNYIDCRAELSYQVTRINWLRPSHSHQYNLMLNKLRELLLEHADP